MNLKSKRTLILLPVAAVVIVAAVVLWPGRKHGGRLVASGTVEATEARLGFEVPGRLAAVFVQEGDPVTAGQVMAVLDTTQIHSQLVEARAQTEAARARLAELERGTRSEEILQARARAAAASDRLQQTRSEFDRTRILHEGGAVSAEAFDQARTLLQVAASDSVQAAQALVQAEKGPRAETIAAQRAVRAQTEAAVNARLAQISLMSTRAPFDGVVTVRHREPGETVAAGSPAVTVTNLRDRWVRIYVPETSIGRVRLGQEAGITCDSFPGTTYPGEVSYIADEAEFTPKNVQTAEERVKLVYMVKVRVSGDPDRDLKPGMPVDVVLSEPAS